jgi:carbonic anhydrase
MKPKLLIAAIAMALSASSTLAADAPHWTYQGANGAKQWGNLEEDFATCKLGKRQSPIDIETRNVKAAKADPIKLSYTSTEAEIANTGHTIQVTPADGGSVTIDGEVYKLVQFHFHTPSEEKINGRQYAMVAHFVHKNAEGKLAVVAVLFNAGKENQALQPVFADLPAKNGEKRPLTGPINASDLMPADHASFSFVGSLTTPPCSEDVRWIVMKAPMTISAQQLKAFKTLYPMNARPTQPLNGRVVQGRQ